MILRITVEPGFNDLGPRVLAAAKLPALLRSCERGAGENHGD